MKTINNEGRSGNLVMQLAICILLVMLFGCNSDSSSSYNDSSDTSSVEFRVVWHDDSTAGDLRYTADLDCDEAGVSTVEGSVYNQENELLGSGVWNCHVGHGTIYNVPAGTNGRVVILGRDAHGEIVFFGESSHRALIGGETIDFGTIDVYPFVPTLSAPDDRSNAVNNDFALAWDLIAGAEEYRVVVSESEDMSDPIIDHTTSNTEYPPSGLSVGAAYYWQVYARDFNTDEGAGSEVWRFNVISIPSAVTEPATAITSRSSTLNGAVNPNGADATYHFEYGMNTDYGSNTTGTDLASGTDPIPVNVVIEDLRPGTQYHFRVVAVNSGGTGYGSDQTFTTEPELPTVNTEPATSVTYESAELNGVVNPNGADTTYHFEYGFDTDYGTNTDAINVGSVTSSVSVSADISGLHYITEYHFRIVAVNSEGTSYGSDETFTTEAAPPTATTDTATPVASSTATLNGGVNPNGADTTYYFEYGFDTDYGFSTTGTGVGSGTQLVSVGTAITDLSPATEYHFRIVAVNSKGTGYGSDLTFITEPAPPTATTDPAGSVASRSATLNGAVNPNGASTTYYFEYDYVTGYGFSTVPVDIGSGTSPVAVSVDISGLYYNIEYHFRVVATNSLGTDYGSEQTFTTENYPDTLVHTEPVGSGPYGITVSPDGVYVYVANSADGTVSVIGTNDWFYIAHNGIQVGTSPYGLAVTPDGIHVYATNSADNTVSVIGTDDGFYIAHNGISVGNSPYGAAVTPDGNYVYVTNSVGNTISVIETSGYTVTDNVVVGNDPHGVAVTPDGNYIYVTNAGDNSVSVMDTSSNTVIDTIDVGVFPEGIAVTPDGSYVYVTNHNENTVSVIRTSDSTVTNTIGVGGSPRGVAVTPNGTYVYVANSNNDTLSVIKTSDNVVIDTISTGSTGDEPYYVAVSPNGNYVYVTNYSAGTVSVFGFWSPPE